MKTNYSIHSQNRKPVSYNQPAYPNAADNRYFAQKSVEILGAILSGMGIMTAMMFLVILA